MFNSSAIVKKYLFKEYLKKFASFFSIFFIICFFIRILENIRLSSSKSTSFLIIFETSLMQTPYLLQGLLSLIIGLASINFIYEFNKKNELITLRAAGVSMWQIFSILSFFSVIFGLFVIIISYPLTAKLEEKAFFHQKSQGNSSYNLPSENNSEIWLKEDCFDQKIIIKASKLDQDCVLYDVSLIILGKNMNLETRIEAERALVSGKFLELENCYIYRESESFGAEFQKKYNIKTHITSKTLKENFSQPSSIAIWRLPAFIYSLTKTGSPAKNYKLHLMFLVLIPLKFINNNLFGLIFASGHMREKKYFFRLIFGVLIIVCYFFVNEIIARLSYNLSISPWLITTIPVIVIFAISLLSLIYIEEV